MKKLHVFRIVPLQLFILVCNIIPMISAAAEPERSIEVEYPNELELNVTSIYDINNPGVFHEIPRIDMDLNIYKFTCPEDLVVTPDDRIIILGSTIDAVGGSGSPADFEEDYEVTVFTNGVPIQLVDEWNGVMWLKMNPDCFGTIVFSNNKDFVPEWAWHLSGIEGVTESEDNAIQYFDMHGVEIANPGKGLYIRVGRDKTEKVTF